MDQPFYLGDWYVEPDRHRISRGDESARLQPKMLAVLQVLVESDGETVEKNDLLDLVWPRQYVFEEVLKRVILKLRKALGDDSRNPSYIETIHKKGYRLVCPVRTASAEAGGGASEWPGGSPFRSLMHFDVEDRAIFFGRSAAVSEAVTALAEQKQRGRGFLLIAGASGVGKSSFARAGLIPALSQERGLSNKDFAILRPAELLDCPPDAVPGRLIAHLTSEQEPPSESQAPVPLLLIDQFEETLSLEGCGEVIDQVHRLARSGLVDVLATVREDFLPALNEWPALVRLKQGAGTLTLGTPSQAELAEILQGPATVAGFRYEISDQHGSLKRKILAEAGQVRQALPLLQFLLHRMYEMREKDLLTWASYRELGGLIGAISKHAEAVMDRLDEKTAKALPRLLDRLTQFDLEHQRVTRRAAPAEEISRDARCKALAKALVNERLLVTNSGAGNAPSVSLVHESLLRHWQRARSWVNDNLDRLAALRRVQMSHLNWRRAGESPDLLLRAGNALADGQSVVALPGIDQELREFVEKSMARTSRRSQIRRAAIAVLIVLTVVSGTATFFANQQRHAAERNLDSANRATDFVIGLFNTTRPNTGAESLSAREMLDEGVRRIPVEFAGDDAIRTRLLHATGRLYLQMREMNRAEELLTLAMRDSRDGTRERYDYAWSLAELHVKRNHEIPDAETDRLLKLAIDNLERSGANDHELANAYWQAARLVMPEWRFSPYYWEEAHDRYSTRALTDDPRAPEMLTQLAVVLAYERREPVKLRDTDRALALFERALATFETQDRNADPKYLEALENAAALEYSVGSTLKGIEYQRQAAEGSRNTLGRLHIATPFRWQTLGDYLLGEGFYPEAEDALQTAAEMYLESYGSETPKWFETSLSVADAWFHMGQHTEAGQLLDALDAKQDRVWQIADHPETWRLWHLRGHLARSAGDIAIAAEAYSRAMRLISRIAAQGDVVRQRIRVELDAMATTGSRDFSPFAREYLDQRANWLKTQDSPYRRTSLRPNTEMLIALVQLGCDHPYSALAGESLLKHIANSWENDTWHLPATENSLADCGHLDLSEQQLQANAESVANLTHPETFMAIQAAQSADQFPKVASESDSR